MLLTDTSHTVHLVTLDPDGDYITRKNLDVNIYKINWRWWWDAGDDNLASYIGNTEHQPIFSSRVNTLNGEGSFQFRIDYPEWGRYLIRVIDPVSGHTCWENRLHRLARLGRQGTKGASRRGCHAELQCRQNILPGR